MKVNKFIKCIFLETILQKSAYFTSKKHKFKMYSEKEKNKVATYIKDGQKMSNIKNRGVYLYGKNKSKFK